MRELNADDNDRARAVSSANKTLDSIEKIYKWAGEACGSITKHVNKLIRDKKHL